MKLVLLVIGALMLSWSSLFYQWFLEQLLASLSFEQSIQGQAERVVTPRATGVVTTGADGPVLRPRTSNHLPRPGQLLLTLDDETAWALGDTKRHNQPFMPVARGSPVIPKKLVQAWGEWEGHPAIMPLAGPLPDLDAQNLDGWTYDYAHPVGKTLLWLRHQWPLGPGDQAYEFALSPVWRGSGPSIMETAAIDTSAEPLGFLGYVLNTSFGGSTYPATQPLESGFAIPRASAGELSGGPLGATFRIAVAILGADTEGGLTADPPVFVNETQAVSGFASTGRSRWRYDSWNGYLDPDTGLCATPTDAEVLTIELEASRAWTEQLEHYLSVRVGDTIHHWFWVRYGVSASPERAPTEAEFYDGVPDATFGPNFDRSNPSDPSANYDYVAYDDHTDGVAGIIDPCEDAVWNFRVVQDDPIPDARHFAWHLAHTLDGAVVVNDLAEIADTPPAARYQQVDDRSSASARMIGFEFGFQVVGSFSPPRLVPKLVYLDAATGAFDSSADISSELATVLASLQEAHPTYSSLPSWEITFISANAWKGRYFFQGVLTLYAEIGGELSSVSQPFSAWLNPDDTVTVYHIGGEAARGYAGAVTQR